MDNRKGPKSLFSNSFEGNGGFHFYRLDDKTWSHKANNCNVSRIDASGLKIEDPQKCLRNYRLVIRNNLNVDLNYNTFVGYYYVLDHGIELAKIEAQIDKTRRQIKNNKF